MVLYIHPRSLLNMFHVVEVASFSFPDPNKGVNEDFVLLPTYDNKSNIVFAIADGVGSLQGASQASICAINAISCMLKENNFSVENALIRSREEIIKLANSDIRYSQAATTLTVIQISENNVTIGHIGDCRAYFKKNGKLIQLTKDHTRYQELLDSREFSYSLLRANKNRLSSVITKALSKKIEFDFDISIIPIDTLIEEDSIVISMMSDGAYEHWHKRARFSHSTMNSPSAFISSLRKRIQKNPIDDFTCLNVRLER